MTDKGKIKQDLDECLAAIGAEKKESASRELASKIAKTMLNNKKGDSTDFLYVMKILSKADPSKPVCTLLLEIKNTMIADARYTGIRTIVADQIMKMPDASKTAKGIATSLKTTAGNGKTNSWLNPPKQSSNGKGNSQADSDSDSENDTINLLSSKKIGTQPTKKTKKESLVSMTRDSSSENSSDDEKPAVAAKHKKKVSSVPMTRDSSSENSSDDEKPAVAAKHKKASTQSAKIVLLDSENENSDEEPQTTTALEVRDKGILQKFMTSSQGRALLDNVTELVTDRIMPEMRKEAKEIAKKQTTKQVTKQMNAVTQSMMIGFEKQEDMLRNLLEKKPERNDASDEMWQEQGVPIHPDRYTVSMFVNSSGSTILDAYAKYTKDSSPANAETLLKKVKGIKTAMKHVVNYATEGKGKKSTIGKFFRELEKKADEESKEPEEESETEPAPKKRKVKKEAQPKPDEGKEEDARHKEEIGSDNELSTSKLAQAADLIKRNLGKGGGAKISPDVKADGDLPAEPDEGEGKH
jgi:hypothetical protein